ATELPPIVVPYGRAGTRGEAVARGTSPGVPDDRLHRPSPLLPRKRGHALRNPRRQRPADPGHVRDLLLLGEDAGAPVPGEPDRDGGRPLRLPRDGQGAAARHAEGGGRLRPTGAAARPSPRRPRRPDRAEDG